MKALTFALVAALIIAASLAIDTAVVWAAVNVVGGLDLSFRELVGGGILLGASQGAGVSAASSKR